MSAAGSVFGSYSSPAPGEPSLPEPSAGTIKFRLPPSAFISSIPGSSSKKAKGKKKDKKGKKRDVEPEFDEYEFNNVPKKPPKRKPLKEILPRLIAQIKWR